MFVWSAEQGTSSAETNMNCHRQICVRLELSPVWCVGLIYASTGLRALGNFGPGAVSAGCKEKRSTRTCRQIDAITGLSMCVNLLHQLRYVLAGTSCRASCKSSRVKPAAELNRDCHRLRELSENAQSSCPVSEDAPDWPVQLLYDCLGAEVGSSLDKVLLQMLRID